MCLWSDQPSLKNTLSFMQNWFVALKKGGDCLKYKFWKIGFKTCVLEEHFISYSCIFLSYIQCFEVSFQKWGYFSKKLFFQNFDWSNLIFDQSKSLFKTSVSLCLVRLIELVFRSIEHRDSSFFKTVFWLIQTLFQNFFKLFSLSLTWQGSTEDFLSFFSQIFARFFSYKAGKTFIPLLLFLFSWFHA